MWRWLDDVPFSLLAAVAVFMALAPFHPEPHLWQKLKMLFSGTLRRPLDVFDLFWHALPLVLLGIKAARALGRG
ncbi:RND transporter [Dissulfurirhabdus thermomarina]|uniref:RND transporter n=1 Tax=Dissulfurirhabdus thermomarina TaxID=1765737 RepID=A0A6N9TQ70_DISTH|nr:RND transporter [Dissulfurirhabdus thermomarina]NDY43198.1 RND transporter [Dissulfurirhabdus thermomarina]NMX23353.1 RND transporter [Dissulfurirhabdus thermomarina]